MLADSFVHPIKYEGAYPNNWAGFYFKERLNYGKWLQVKGFHLGVDYNRGVNDLGDPVYAIANGKVKGVGSSSVYGYRITIEHTLTPELAKHLGATKVISLYGHVQKPKVKVGQTVAKGKQICELGKAGTQWPHLHLELYKPHNYSAVSSVYPAYPADNLTNLNKNYYDPYRTIQANLKVRIAPTNDKEIEVFKTDKEVQQAYMMLRGSIGTAAERKHWIGVDKQKFFTTGLTEANNYRKQLADVKKALATIKSQPPKTVVKEIEKIVEVPIEKITVKEVEVIKEVKVEKPHTWQSVIGFIKAQIAKFTRSK